MMLGECVKNQSKSSSSNQGTHDLFVGDGEKMSELRTKNLPLSHRRSKWDENYLHELQTKNETERYSL